jgi:multidrug efflux pump subunit AcrB
VIVLRLALRSWRVTFVAALAVPVVLATTLLLLEALGMTLNIMTLGGMAAAVGLVIDDGIVMVEHVLRRLRERPTAERRATAIAAGREMISPLTGSSAATIVIFAPLAYLSGVSGAFFKPLAVTMASTLVVSWLFSMLALPLLCALVLRPEDAASEDVGPTFRRVLERYERVLRLLLERPLLVLVPVGIVVGLGGIGYRLVGTGFMPVMDEGGFVLDYRAPPGTSLTETDRQLRELEKVLASVPEIVAYSRRTGLSLGGHITEANEGDFFVRLRPPPRRSTEAVIDDVRDQVNARVPGLQIELAQLIEDLIGDLTAVPQPIEVKLFGPDAALLLQATDEVAKAVGAVPGVVDVKNGVVLAGDGLEIQVDRERARLLGLDPEQVTRFASLALQGRVVTQLQQNEKMVGIRVWTDAAARSTPEQLRRLLVRNPAGAAVPLGRFTQFTRAIGQPQITRENLSTMLAITGRISGRDLGSVMQDVQHEMAGLSLPPGSYVRYGGLYREQRESFHALTLVLLAAPKLVFVLLFYLYERPSAPVAILAVSGIAVAGVFVGLWWTGSELDISSLMGLTMVVGISAEAGVFLLTQWQESSRGLPLESALLEAGRVRFRPIAMTGLAAILALLPLALGIGQGAAMLQPLAIAIVSGLIVTVPAVLLVLPVLLLRLERGWGDPG